MLVLCLGLKQGHSTNNYTLLSVTFYNLKTRKQAIRICQSTFKPHVIAQEYFSMALFFRSMLFYKAIIMDIKELVLCSEESAWLWVKPQCILMLVMLVLTSRYLFTTISPAISR